MTTAVKTELPPDGHRDSEWQERAACRGTNPHDFAPTIATSRSSQYDRERAERVVTAQRWCASCPVLAECGAAADKVGEEGLWAGSLRRKDHHMGRYVADQLIPGAPASLRTRNYGAVTA